MKTIKKYEVFSGSLDEGQAMQDAGYPKDRYFNVVKVEDVLGLIDEMQVTSIYHEFKDKKEIIKMCIDRKELKSRIEGK